MRNYTRDEGGPFGFGDQESIPSHRELVWPKPDTLRSLAAMSWQRPNIGSRVTREGHARFWERPEVKFLRAT